MMHISCREMERRSAVGGAIYKGPRVIRDSVETGLSFL